MAETIGIASGIIGLAGLSSQVTKTLLKRRKDSLGASAAELEIHTLILKEISDIVLQNGDVPQSAISCMSLCQQNLTELAEAAHSEGLKSEKIWPVLRAFMKSTMLLRDIVME